jgi:hypothetical protein
MTQEEFVALIKQWDASNDQERELMLPFCTPKERKELSYFYAETENRCRKIMWFYTDKPSYDKVVTKFGDQHRMWQELGNKAIEKQKAEIEAQRRAEEKKENAELYKQKKQGLSTDYEVTQLTFNTPIKDVKQPKPSAEPKVKRERVSGEGTMAFEGFGDAEPVESLRGNSTGSVQGGGRREVVSRREPKPE